MQRKKRFEQQPTIENKRSYGFLLLKKNGKGRKTSRHSFNALDLRSTCSICNGQKQRKNK